MPDLVTHVLSVKQGRAEWYKLGQGGSWTERQWWDYLANVPLLVLDDVGLHEVNSEFQTETLFLALKPGKGSRSSARVISAKWQSKTVTVNTSGAGCAAARYSRVRGRDRRYPEDEV